MLDQQPSTPTRQGNLMTTAFRTDETGRCYEWFCVNSYADKEQHEQQPTAFLNTQEDVKRFEDSLEAFEEFLQEYANTHWSTKVKWDNISWAELADHLIARHELTV